MQKTQKPVIGGILSIIEGAINMLGAFGVLISVLFVPENTGILLLIIAAGLFITSILPIIGGIFAIQRKQWGLALAGSIFATIGDALLGIPALILIALSKDEFE